MQGNFHYIRAGITALSLVASVSLTVLGSPASFALSPPAAHFAPEEDLEALDVRALDALPGGGYVNAAMFVLSDYRVIAALARAAARGKTIRVYLDPRELRMLHLRADHPLCRLAQTSNVTIKVKSADGELMHDKDWSADGSLWRTGSANASVSGLKAQDNSLIFMTDRGAIATFDRHFELMWARTNNSTFSSC